MELTWIAIVASLCMGMGAALVFVFAVKKNYFKNLEDAKYHMFWSDMGDQADSNQEEQRHGEEASEAQRG